VRRKIIARAKGSMVSWWSTRAEDRATVGTESSADPGAKTEGRAEDRSAFSARSSHSFGIGTKAINPSRRSREQFNTEQRSMPGDGLPDQV
jgi:hypothetical protein